MAILKGKTRQTSAVSRVSEGADGYIRLSRDGSLINVPWIQALVLEGRVFHAYFGNASTVATLDASWANTDPDISLDVPSGTSIIPLQIRVSIEAFGTTALFETMALCTKTLGAASAGTVFTPLNINNRSSLASSCACYTGPTVTSGYTTGAFELYRTCIEVVATTATGDDDSNRGGNYFEWSAATAGFAPVLQGESSLQVWATSQAATGYIHLFWAELPTSAIS